MPCIASIKAEGSTSLRQIAAALNERDITTPRGGQWTAMQVHRLMQNKGVRKAAIEILIQQVQQPLEVRSNLQIL